MPQVFGAQELTLISEASLWFEAGEVDSRNAKAIEKATHPMVAAEARARGLVPLRMGNDPIWHHPDTGEQVVMTPSHAGDQFNRGVANAMAFLKRNFPTEEELARAGRTPEEVEQAQADAAAATKSKKQQKADAAKRAKEQAAAVQFKRLHAPFRNMDEIATAHKARLPRVRISEPGETLEQFAQRLRESPPEYRQQVHRMVFQNKGK